jgi:hypothetical protein
MTEETDNTAASAPVHAFVHTPGPWEVRDHEGLFAIAHPTGWVMESSDEQQNRTDARLIAAAPDLLEACKAALAAISSACQDGSIIWLDPPFVLPGVHESAAERLQNVIERAESVV